MDDVVALLKHDGVGVFPTDTLYGLVGRASSTRAVSRIYDIKGRDEHKPFIILISSLTDLKNFKITLTPVQKKFLQKNWPNQLSVILPCPQKQFEYLHRGTKSLAFRYPKDVFLQKLLKKTGPLFAPSANPQGEQPAETITEAQQYFADSVDFYVSKGKKKGQASTIVDLTKDIPMILRQGKVKIKKS